MSVEYTEPKPEFVYATFDDVHDVPRRELDISFNPSPNKLYQKPRERVKRKLFHREDDEENSNDAGDLFPLPEEKRRKAEKNSMEFGLCCLEQDDLEERAREKDLTTHTVVVEDGQFLVADTECFIVTLEENFAADTALDNAVLVIDMQLPGVEYIPTEETQKIPLIEVKVNTMDGCSSSREKVKRKLFVEDEKENSATTEDFILL